MEAILKIAVIFTCFAAPVLSVSFEPIDVEGSGSGSGFSDRTDNVRPGCNEGKGIIMMWSWPASRYEEHGDIQMWLTPSEGARYKLDGHCRGPVGELTGYIAPQQLSKMPPAGRSYVEIFIYFRWSQFDSPHDTMRHLDAGLLKPVSSGDDLHKVTIFEGYVTLPDCCAEFCSVEVNNSMISKCDLVPSQPLSTVRHYPTRKSVRFVWDPKQADGDLDFWVTTTCQTYKLSELPTHPRTPGRFNTYVSDPGTYYLQAYTLQNGHNSSDVSFRSGTSKNAYKAPNNDPDRENRFRIFEGYIRVDCNEQPCIIRLPRESIATTHAAKVTTLARPEPTTSSAMPTTSFAVPVLSVSFDPIDVADVVSPSCMTHWMNEAGIPHSNAVKYERNMLADELTEMHVVGFSVELVSFLVKSDINEARSLQDCIANRSDQCQNYAPCRNEGKCQLNERKNAYVCVCHSDYTGRFCTKRPPAPLDEFRELQGEFSKLQEEFTEYKNVSQAKLKFQGTGCSSRSLGYRYQSRHHAYTKQETGAIATMTFPKKYTATVLRLTYSSNIRVRGRVQGSGGSGRWYFKIDGQECSKPTKIDIAVHNANVDNDHNPSVLLGICEETAAGPIQKGIHTITVNVGRISPDADGDVFSNWHSTSLMEVQEMCPQF